MECRHRNTPWYGLMLEEGAEIVGSAGGDWECWKGLGVQEWEWPDSAVGAQRVEFAGGCCFFLVLVGRD